MPQMFAIVYPTYLPAMRIITSITRDFPALVTTSFSNSYVSGEIVRINTPQVDGYYPWGMQQINNLTGAIDVISSTQFYIDIDTRTFDPFITPDPTPIRRNRQRPQVVPIGEVNSTLNAATQNVL